MKKPEVENFVSNSFLANQPQSIEIMLFLNTNSKNHFQQSPRVTLFKDFYSWAQVESDIKFFIKYLIFLVSIGIIIIFWTLKDCDKY